MERRDRAGEGSGRLVVDFAGEVHELQHGDSLDFGREADLEIDSNPYLHRRLGRFESRSGLWWVVNTGASVVLNVRERSGRSSAVVAPGASLALCAPEMAIAFTAGNLRYELEVDIDCPVLADRAGRGRHLGPTGAADDAGRTVEFGAVELTPDQRLLLVVLCAPRLMGGGAADLLADAPLPSRGECAHRLGWSLSKLGRKLDHLCIKLAKAGVTGLVGADGAPAMGRRQRLVEHALASGMITDEDLAAVVVDHA